ncbi:hydrolase [Veronia nyctiphanis]|uniref:Hydrolase n=1 Tax=Veronia nyctiphanis TaxID=1278244 RepID=A0A4V1LT05_9GAMM|nr:hydrolase [Veronia nyctiphanis]RXJ73518.1 hydrolase [Veronia nyctiphanis]
MEFTPIAGISNPHLQTLLPRFIRRKALFEPVWQRLDTDDGDFLDICWTEAPEQAKNKPVVVLFHGLAGCFHSPYANGLMAAFKARGWLGVVMHFRGCSGALNRLPRGYHSGETQDARFFINYLTEHFPDVPKAAVGVSLGGNMLIQYLAKYQQDANLVAGCAISPPLDLGDCATRIQKGFSRVYQAYLLNSMNHTLKERLMRHPKVGSLSSGDKIDISSIYEFDQRVTAPMFGFDSADSYYQQCSGLVVLPQVRQPFKVIHAKDDPFMTDAVIPTQTLPDNIDYQLTEYGGHVGFMSGSLSEPVFWLEKAVPEFLAPHLGRVHHTQTETSTDCNPLPTS